MATRAYARRCGLIILDRHRNLTHAAHVNITRLESTAICLLLFIEMMDQLLYRYVRIPENLGRYLRCR